jgi:hypothetical protein
VIYPSDGTGALGIWGDKGEIRGRDTYPLATRPATALPFAETPAAGHRPRSLVVRKLRKNPNCGREPSAGLDLLEWHPRDLKQAYHDFKRGLLAMDACTTIS